MGAKCPPTTTIVGPVLDQAALYGLLNRVRDMGLSLVSVKRIKPRDGLIKKEM